MATPSSDPFETQQRQTQAFLEANRMMADGVLTSFACINEAATIAATSVWRRAAAGELPFGPLSLFMLSKEEEAKVEEDVGRSFNELMTSARKATEVLARAMSEPRH